MYHGIFGIGNGRKYCIIFSRCFQDIVNLKGNGLQILDGSYDTIQDENDQFIKSN